MSRHQVGDRVYAIASATDDTVYAFGEGTYVGRKAVPKGRGFLGVDDMENHCIELDSGETVYGHECWWGSEAAMQGYTEGRCVVLVSITDYYREQTP